eukprot:s216_g33.t1
MLLMTLWSCVQFRQKFLMRLAMDLLVGSSTVVDVFQRQKKLELQNAAQGLDRIDAFEMTVLEVDSTPTISFDHCYTKASAVEADAANVDSTLVLVMVDSSTGYLGCVPVQSKDQYQILVREVLAFTQILGHSEVTYRCDNEPTIKNLQRMLVQTRLNMGLTTRASTSTAYVHASNSLVENSIGRIRQLAGTLMHHVKRKLNIDFNSTHALWSWAFKHATWLLNRFSVVRGHTPYELLYGSTFRGRVCEFAEPVFAFITTALKGNSKWHRAIFLTKLDNQDSYLLFDGSKLALSRSVRRIQTDWRGHMAYYLQFRCHSWEYRTNMGGRVVPTKNPATPVGVSFRAPRTPAVPTAFYDAEAEAVKAKAREELREEREAARMETHDSKQQPLEPLQDAPKTDLQSVPAESSTGMGMASDCGTRAPTTPTDRYQEVLRPLPPSPRHDPVRREHDDDALVGEAEPESEISRVEDDHKKQRINQLKEVCETSVRLVQFGDQTFHTMDDYDTELDVQNSSTGDDLWHGEEEIQFINSGIPEEFWSDVPTDSVPPEPAAEVDRLADQVEIARLLSMGVLTTAADYHDEVADSLTTRFVYDWRVKQYGSGDEQRPRWLRRSRFVAREYAVTKRDDVYSPATGSHTTALVPLIYLQKLAEEKEIQGSSSVKTVLASVDVADAFLQVDQEKPFRVRLHGCGFVVLKNLPGQRMGARSWHMHFRQFCSTTLGYEWCVEEPCLARNKDSCLVLHVDDILLCGGRQYYEEMFLPTLKSKFSVSSSSLDGPGSSIKFLKRKIEMLQDESLVLVPSTTASKVISSFEKHFGTARMQYIPCDASIQLEDVSSALSDADASHFRSIVGMALHMGRDRPDLMFTIKELSAKMSAPTLTAVARLRKMIGYLKFTGDLGIHLQFPSAGSGMQKRGVEHWWLLESYADADWASNKAIVRAPRVVFTCSMEILHTAAVVLRRLGMLMCEIGVLDLETQTAYGWEERDQVRDKHLASKNFARVMKMLIQLGMVTGSLGPTGADAAEVCELPQQQTSSWWMWLLCFLAVIFMAMFALMGLKVFHCMQDIKRMWTQVCALNSTSDVFLERLGDTASSVSALRDDRRIFQIENRCAATMFSACALPLWIWEEQGEEERLTDEDIAVEPSAPAGSQEVPRPSRRSDTPRAAHGPFPAPITLKVQIDGLRRELNAAMFAGEFRKAGDLQQQILENLNLLHQRNST